MLDGILFGAIWFSMFVLGHIAVFHLKPFERRTRIILVLYLGALAGVLLTVIVLPTDIIATAQPGVDYRPLNGLAGLVTMGCLFIVYMPTYYTFATSQSVQVVVRIYRATGRRLSMDDVVQVATSDSVLRRRLESMEASGNLVRSGERYFGTPRARRVGSVFGLIQRLWRLDSVG